MFPKQKEKIQNKIAKIERTLAAEKRRWGCTLILYFHDRNSRLTPSNAVGIRCL